MWRWPYLPDCCIKMAWVTIIQVLSYYTIAYNCFLICVHPTASHCSSMRVVVTHLPYCHIKMGLPFVWQDNSSEITPLRKTRLNPHLRMSVHLFRFQGTHDYFIFLTTRRNWTSRTTDLGVWTRTQNVPSIMPTLHILSPIPFWTFAFLNGTC